MHDERYVPVRPSRRTFLKTAGAPTAVVVAGPTLLRAYGGLGSPAFAADMLGDTLPAGAPIVLLVDLQGGNDALNTLVPVSDPWYYDATYGHGSLAVPAAQALALDTVGHRLHPALTWLRDAWNANSPGVAFVQGVGENVTNQFSHFEAQDQWWTCDFTGTQTLGWLGRFNDARHGGEALASICVSGLHPILVGNSVNVLAVQDVEGFELGVHWRGIWTAPGLGEAMQMMQAAGGTGPVGECQQLFGQTYAASDTIRATHDPTLLTGITDWFVESLVHAATMIRGGVPCQTYVASLGGFDSHDNQAAAHQTQLGRLNEGLSRFFAALGSHERRRDVVVVVHSEFGRKVTMNGTNGTDHGQAGVTLVIGDRVKRGMYGEAPTLDPGGANRPNRIYDAMRPTVDFRSVFTSTLQYLSGGDTNLTESILGGTFEDLGFIGPPPLEMFPDVPPVAPGPGAVPPPPVRPRPLDPVEVPPVVAGSGPGPAVSPSPQAVSAARATSPVPTEEDAAELDVVEAARAGAASFRRGRAAATTPG